MLPDIKQHIAAHVAAAIERAAPGGAATVLLERPKIAAHGDLATSVALQLAKPLKRNPRELAQAIVAALLADESARALIAHAEIAGPGFVNLKLQPSAKQSVVRRVLDDAEAFGRTHAHRGERVMVEFVSANPTGPLHVGHGRQAALGDAIAQLLATQGYEVTREFYYNDAGAQIANLAMSVQARARGIAPDHPDWPADGYRGEYIADIAADFLAKKTVHADDRAFTASGDANDLESIRLFAVAYLRHEQDLDLQAFGVKFDRYSLESSLYAERRVERTVQALVAAGKTYESDGALWLRTTDYGDDKDRVMRKSDGSFTYFVPDVAYHLTKWERGFMKVVNVQGSDHHGTIARVRAGLQAVGGGIPAGYPDYVLHKMVTVMRGGEEVKISKRAGSYVTLRDLIEWTGRDAVRFFLASRKSDTEFIFDVDLALRQNDENPVYYVQYAHARISSVIATWQERERGEVAALRYADLAPLTSDKEAALMQRLAEYPESLAQAASDFAPHQIAFYARELAADFHSFYNADRVLVDEVSTKHARLALLLATQRVLRDALALLGVSAPDKM